MKISILITTVLLSIAATVYAQTPKGIAASTTVELLNANNTLNGIDRPVSLEDYKNVSGFLLVFTCMTCEHAVAVEDALPAIHRKYAPKGYPVVVVHARSDDASIYDTMKAHAKAKDFPFAYLYDADNRMAAAYNTTYTPRMVVLKRRNGKLMVAYAGSIDGAAAETIEMAISNSNLTQKGGLPLQVCSLTQH